MATNVLQAF